MIIGLHIILLLAQVFLYYLMSDITQYYLILISVSSVIFSSILTYRTHYKSSLKNKLYSISFIFLLMLLIVNIQIPIDYLLGNEQINFTNYFHKTNEISLLCSLVSSLIIAYNIGVCYSIYKLDNISNSRPVNTYKIRSYPIFVLCMIFFILFLLTINSGYINGGHGTVKARPIALSFYTWYLRLSIVYISVCYFNKQSQSIKQLALAISPFFYFSVIISCSIFLMAHNRVYVIFLLVPLVFIFLVKKRFKFNLISFVIVMLAVGSLFTAFKIFGIEGLLNHPIKSLSSIGTSENYSMFSSFSPFTVELAGSIYATSILLSLYNSGYFLWGTTLIIGGLKIFPGLVSFVTLLGFDISIIDSAKFITRYVGASYGLGTSFLGETLVNFGYPLSILVLFLTGYYFTKMDIKIFRRDNIDFMAVVIWTSLSSNVIFLARGSISDFLGVVGFCVLFASFYCKIKGIRYYE